MAERRAKILKEYEDRVIEVQNDKGQLDDSQRYLDRLLSDPNPGSTTRTYYIPETRKRINELTLQISRDLSYIKELERRAQTALSDEDYYRHLCRQMNMLKSSREFLSLAYEFRSMDGYRDSNRMAAECDKEAKEWKVRELPQNYANLTERLKAALTSRDKHELNSLVRNFEELGGYKDSAALSKQCADTVEKISKEEKDEKERVEREKRQTARLKKTIKIMAVMAVMVIVLVVLLFFGPSILTNIAEEGSPLYEWLEQNPNWRR